VPGEPGPNVGNPVGTVGRPPLLPLPGRRNEVWSIPMVGRGPLAPIQVSRPPSAVATPHTAVNATTGSRTR
jgi:hypothetical protein